MSGAERGERTKDQIARLIIAIEKEFPTAPRPKVITACPCPECHDLVKDFDGREWRGISDKKLEANFGKLPLFFAEAFHYFLPAYLTYSLKHFVLHCEVCQFTIYALTPEAKSLEDPKQYQWLRERFSTFDRRQAAVILKFLDLVSSDQELIEFHGQLERSVSNLKSLLRNLNLL